MFFPLEMFIRLVFALILVSQFVSWFCLPSKVKKLWISICGLKPLCNWWLLLFYLFGNASKRLGSGCFLQGKRGNPSNLVFFTLK